LPKIKNRNEEVETISNREYQQHKRADMRTLCSDVDKIMNSKTNDHVMRTTHEQGTRTETLRFASDDEPVQESAASKQRHNK